ncbi:MAG: hypothetical protein OXU20_23810 [Myxococcales bacterium]|nr:hypothetical protein [Myxococcales bacterium]MDD9967380.1 hypothetical protein [Myxococcales bacterium]
MGVALCLFVAACHSEGTRAVLEASEGKRAMGDDGGQRARTEPDAGTEATRTDDAGAGSMSRGDAGQDGGSSQGGGPDSGTKSPGAGGEAGMGDDGDDPEDPPDPQPDPLACPSALLLLSHKPTRLALDEGTAMCARPDGASLVIAPCDGSERSVVLAIEPRGCTTRIRALSDGGATCLSADDGGVTFTTCDSDAEAQAWNLTRQAGGYQLRAAADRCLTATDGEVRLSPCGGQEQTFWLPDSEPLATDSREPTGEIELLAEDRLWYNQTGLPLEAAGASEVAFLDGDRPAWVDPRPDAELTWRVRPTLASPFLFCVTYAAPMPGALLEVLLNDEVIGRVELSTTPDFESDARVVVAAQVSEPGVLRVRNAGASIPFRVYDLRVMQTAALVEKAGTIHRLPAEGELTLGTMDLWNMHRAILRGEPPGWGWNRARHYIEYAIAVGEEGVHEVWVEYHSGEADGGLLVQLDPSAANPALTGLPVGQPTPGEGGDFPVASIELPAAPNTTRTSQRAQLHLHAGVNRIRLRTDNVAAYYLTQFTIRRVE